jgi:carotene biosynthesis associated membrane protein
VTAPAAARTTRTARTARAPHAEPPGRAPARGQRGALVLAGVAVLAEVSYPLVHGVALNRLTEATVVVFAAAGAAHALATHGRGWTARMLALFVVGGLAVEVVGVHTGWPFGRYSYRPTLGPELAGVPVVVALAWAMLGYPALVMGRHLATGRLGRAVAGGLALAAWDVFLDPQMVAAGHWVWRPGGGPRLDGVPVGNLAGWLVVGVALMALAQWVLPVGAPAGAAVDDRLPVGLYAWTAASSLLANLVFFHRPEVALAGGVAMGAVLAAAARRRR